MDKDFKKELELVIKDFRDKKIKFKNIAKNIGVAYITLYEYLNKKPSIPLYIINNIDNFYSTNLIDKISYLESGHARNRAKIPKKITKTIAKIIGAHIADGHLMERKTKWKNKEDVIHYEIVLREEYLTNASKFCEWMNKTFKTKIKPKKNKGHYEVYISHKIIFLFFRDLFNLPVGRKTEIAKAPEFIKTKRKLMHSFLIGLLMFDGSVEYKQCIIGLMSRSKYLILDAADFLNKINIKPDYIRLKPDKYNRGLLTIYKQEKLQKGMSLFEKNTEKWHRLKEHFGGFGEAIIPNTSENLKKLILELDNLYPRKRKSSLTFSDIIKALKILEIADTKQISNFVERKNTTTKNFLHKLQQWKIVISKRENLKTVWMLNFKLPIIRRNEF